MTSRSQIVKMASETYRPLIAKAILNYKKAEEEGGGSSAFDLGKEYAAPVGYGAGAGALAGIPIALLANAAFGKDRSLRSYLRSALLGGIGGAGLGALGGGALQKFDPELASSLMGQADSALGQAGESIGSGYDKVREAILGKEPPYTGTAKNPTGPYTGGWSPI